jgi:hypothetical protein
MKFVVEVIMIGGDIPEFLEASCSGSAFSAPIVSVSTSVVPNGAMKLIVSTASGGSLTHAEIATGLFQFLAVYEVLLGLRLLRLFIS